MSGIGGVRSWLEDFVLNKNSYDNNYVINFIKVADLWKQCLDDFKACKSIRNCNDTYSKYIDKVEKLREQIEGFFGRNKVPCGISDSLDYFEDAVGELEDKYLDKLTAMDTFRTTINFDWDGYDDMVLKEYTKDYPQLKFELDANNHIVVEGDYWEVREFLEDNLYDDCARESIENGEFR